MLDVSHVIPLSLDSQVLGVAAEVIELVHVDSGSPIADLAATVATRLPCLNEFSIPNPESRIHPESINAKQCQVGQVDPSGNLIDPGLLHWTPLHHSGPGASQLPFLSKLSKGFPGIAGIAVKSAKAPT